MPIRKDSVVTIHYTLKDDDGKIIDSSQGNDPLTYLHGHGNLVPGLESELEGKDTGTKLTTIVKPDQGYGDYDQALVQQVPRRALQKVGNLSVGMRLRSQTPDGPRDFQITRMVGDMVTVDGNHPLAGKNLNFDVDVVEICDASAEELAHGHVHGPGGHHH